MADCFAQTPDWQQDIFFFVVAHAGAAQLTQKQKDLGVAVVNIDNGFGAGYMASLINK